ncbi:MAG: peptidoglycan-binding domain-containing protein [Caulobacteraceae bacterium]
MTKFRSSRLLGLFAAVAAIGAPTGGAFAGASDLPPAAKPGECYGRVYAPPVYGKEGHKVLVRPASTETRLVPGRTEKVRKRVLVQAAHTERVRVEPVYRDVVRVLTTPGARHWVREPARYEIVQERVLLEPAHAVWKRVNAPLAAGGGYPGQTRIEPTGDVFCRVLIPARYGYANRRVKVASSRMIEVVGRPHKERVVVRQMVRKGGWKVLRTPAVYRTEWTTMNRASRKVVVKTHAVYRNEGARTMVRAGGLAWERVFCGGQLAPDFIRKVQAALANRGYDPGPIDGEARPETYAALRKFQTASGLAQGQLTIATAKALGVW